MGRKAIYLEPLKAVFIVIEQKTADERLSAQRKEWRVRRVGKAF
jgi:hypothetical protein